jgi:hypothetical protein
MWILTWKSPIGRGFSSTYEAKRQNEVLSISLLDEVIAKPSRNVNVYNLVCNNDHPFHYCSTIDPNLGSNPHNLIHINPEKPLQDASLSSNCVKSCPLNAQSLNNKSAQFTDFICEHTPDLDALAETWFTDKESSVKTLSTPSRYNFFDEPHLNR